MLKRKRIAACFLIVLLLISAFAISTVAADNNPYPTYTYWVKNDERIAVPARAMYEMDTVLRTEELGVGALSSANDIETDAEGNLYIADTANNRIVVVDKNLKQAHALTEFTYQGDTLTLQEPQGVFVTKDKSLFIADTKNARVLESDSHGVINRIITLPDSSVIPDDYQFLPIKTAVDSEGYVYILSSGSYYGALLFNPSGDFICFYGCNTVQGTVLSSLNLMWETLMPNDEKKAASQKKLPFTFNDLCISEDFVFTVTGHTETTKVNASRGQLKKLSPGGSNILKSNTGLKSSDSSSVSFQDKGYYRGILYASNVLGNLESNFSSVYVHDDLIYLLDSTYGKIFVYDSECHNLNVFGTGLEVGAQDGTFQQPSALTAHDGHIFVLDARKNSITVFSMTEYGMLLRDAQKLSLKGNYAEARPMWESVLNLDANSQLAYQALGKASYDEGDYASALVYSKTGCDRNTYALARQQVRNSWLSSNFTWLFALTLVLIGAAIIFLVYKKKKGIVWITNPTLKTLSGVWLHPFDSFSDVKFKARGSVTLATILCALFYVSTVAYDMYAGFAFSTFEKSSYNSFITFLSSIGIVLLWVVVEWGCCSLLQGKGHLKEVYIVTSYSLMPLIVGKLGCLLLSHLLLPGESAFISIFSTVCTLLAGFFLIVGCMIIHEYNFFRLAGTTIIVLFGMFLVVFIIFLMLILFQEAGNFISTIYMEITMR